jgi:hypothetical protein
LCRTASAGDHLPKLVGRTRRCTAKAYPKARSRQLDPLTIAYGRSAPTLMMGRAEYAPRIAARTRGPRAAQGIS